MLHRLLQLSVRTVKQLKMIHSLLTLLTTFMLNMKHEMLMVILLTIITVLLASRLMTPQPDMLKLSALTTVTLQQLKNINSLQLSVLLLKQA